MKNKKNDPDRITLKKYCRFCKKHTEHRETR
jgi:large subunit ribosomal protein L33